MEKSDWAELLARADRTMLAGLLWRAVESQKEIATRDLVDTLEEQAFLEEMIEESKPALPTGAARLHYLLATPFRYPPLKRGSRFGTRLEASLFYGSLAAPTAFAELAYYRFVFRSGVAEDFPVPLITTGHTLFSANYELKPGFDLRSPPFAEHAELLTHKSDYHATQALGAAMRGAEAAGFYFTSARCPDAGTNIALFTPDAFPSTRPVEQYQCYAETSADQVFIRVEGSGSHRFPRNLFFVDGQLPHPA